MNKHITLQAEGEFPFVFYIEKAVPKDEDGMMIVEGVASTVNVDHDNERMAESALVSMAQVINEKGVPLRLEHNQDETAIVGSVYRAWVDDRNQLWIRAAIDPNHPAGPVLHDSLKQGSKFGLSVGGKVRRAIRELVESTGKMVKTFYDVSLDEVSVTRKPANYDAWLFAKSIKGKDEDVTPYYGSPLYRQFLFENQQLDYIGQFAKSVPDKAWKQISNKEFNKNTMDEDKKKVDEETKKAEDKKEEESTEKSGFVSKSEFTKFGDMVAKGFSELAALVKDMKDSAKDTTNPDKDQEIPDEQQTAKNRDGQEDEGENGGEEKKEASEKAKEQTNPDKDLPEDETQQTAKSEEKDGEAKKSEEKDEEEKKEKSEKKDEEEDTEKSEDDEKEEGTMKSMADAIASIGAISKKSKGVKVTKSRKIASIDEFAVTVAHAIESLDEKFEKSGKRVPGLASQIVDTIKNDPKVQALIVGMMGEPGFKKSVSMGVPYMRTKDGKMFALTASPVGADAEQVKKSRDGKSFKDVYKSEFSSIKEDQQ